MTGEFPGEGPPELARAVGRRLRALRDEHGVTADAVAAQARRIGLGWQRSTVATLEAGRRRLTGEELLLLPLLLSMALPVKVGLHDLLDDEVALTDELVMTRSGFRQLLDESTTVWGGYKLRAGSATGRGRDDRPSSLETWEQVQRCWPEIRSRPEASLERLRAVEQSAAGDAELNAARTLGRSPLDVAATAHRLWGHGLTQERERRLAALSVPGESTSTARVRRGHVTRALLDELGPSLQEHA